MMRIKLKNTPLVLITIPRFSRFLASSDLEITQQIGDSINKTIELVINARFYGAVKWATGLAYDCFEDAVIDISSETEKSLMETRIQPSAH